MEKKSIVPLILAVAVIAILAVGGVYFYQQGGEGSESGPVAVETGDGIAESAQIANPASKNCADKGGRLEMRQSTAGEYGVCIFEDNRQCEEWALMRGQCPVGGVKVTGYENEAEVYCAITGGTVEGAGTPVPMCKRTDGTLCSAQANLDGACPDPSDPAPNAGNVEAE